MQYLRKEVSDEVDVLHAVKHESLLQINTIILMGIVKRSQSSLKYLKKEVRDEVDLLHVDKHQSFLQVNFNTLGIKDAYKVILSFIIDGHDQSFSKQQVCHIFTIPQKVRNAVHLVYAVSNIKK